MPFVDKNTNAKDIFFPHGTKQVWNIYLQRISMRSAFAEKRVYVMYSPMIIQGAYFCAFLDSFQELAQRMQGFGLWQLFFDASMHLLIGHVGKNIF